MLFSVFDCRFNVSPAFPKKGDRRRTVTLSPEDVGRFISHLSDDTVAVSYTHLDVYKRQE